MQDGQGRQAEEHGTGRYWPRVQRITAVLLVVWLLATVVGPWFARDLARVQWFGFPLSFWVASQGALLVYLAIIIVYAVLMDRLEQRDSANEGPPSLPVPPADASTGEGRHG